LQDRVINEGMASLLGDQLNASITYSEKAKQNFKNAKNICYCHNFELE
jgi:hypothetical protein